MRQIGFALLWFCCLLVIKTSCTGPSQEDIRWEQRVEETKERNERCKKKRDEYRVLEDKYLHVMTNLNVGDRWENEKKAWELAEKIEELIGYDYEFKYYMNHGDFVANTSHPSIYDFPSLLDTARPSRWRNVLDVLGYPSKNRP